MLFYKLTLSFCPMSLFLCELSLLICHFLSLPNMGCCCPGGASNDNGDGKLGGKSGCSGNSHLVGASKATLDHFLTQEERQEILANASISIPLRLLLNAPFCTFSAFSKSIYLTGIGGITIENLRQFNIKVCRQCLLYVL